MTFLELEKECKKRKLFRIFKITVLVLTVTGVAGFGYVFFQNKQIKKPKPLKNENNITERKTVKKEKTVNKPKKQKPLHKEKLKLIIDLNISDVKEKKTDRIKPSKQLNLKDKTTEIKKTEVSLKTTTLPSFQTCIKLSQKYYNEKNYKEALKWAKNANLQNNKNPLSWIMSAKALYKLGKKKEALKILKIYYNYHKDEKVKRLMGELNESN